MNKKIKPQLTAFCILASLILSVIFKMLTEHLHIDENNVAAINVLQVLYRIIILGLPLLLIVIVKDNENYILSVANKEDSPYGWKDYFLIKKLSFSHFLGGLILSFITVIMCYLMKSSLFNLYYGITGKVVFAGENLLSKTTMEINVYSVIIAIISLVLIPAILEEALFRGSTYNSLRGYNVLFVIFSTVTFALLHQNILQLPFVLSIGIVCSLVMIYAENTSIAVFIHMIANICVVFVLDRISLPFDLSKTMLHEEHSMALYYALIGFGISVFCFLCIVIIISIFLKKDKNKESHFNLKKRDKIFYLLVIGIFLAVFAMEVM